MFDKLLQLAELAVYGEGADALLLVPLFLVCLSILVYLRPLKKYLAEQRLFRAIKSQGQEVLRNIILPDGMDGLVFVENLILTADGIVIFSIKRYPGLIFAGESIDEWTQMIGSRSYKFPNPLRLMESDVSAVKSQVPDVNVYGRVVFSMGSHFPKGQPEQVILARDLIKHQTALRQDDIEPALMKAWEKLRALAQTAGKHMLVRIRIGMARYISSGILLLLAAVWILWKLGVFI